MKTKPPYAKNVDFLKSMFTNHEFSAYYDGELVYYTITAENIPNPKFFIDKDHTRLFTRRDTTLLNNIKQLLGLSNA